MRREKLAHKISISAILFATIWQHFCVAFSPCHSPLPLSHVHNSFPAFGLAWRWRINFRLIALKKEASRKGAGNKTSKGEREGCCVQQAESAAKVFWRKLSFAPHPLPFLSPDPWPQQIQFLRQTKIENKVKNCTFCLRVWAGDTDCKNFAPRTKLWRVQKFTVRRVEPARCSSKFKG